MSSNKKLLSSSTNIAILQKRIFELEREKEKLKKDNKSMKEKILDKYLKNETINNEDDLINHIEAVLEEVAVVIDFLEKQEEPQQPKSSSKKEKLSRLKGALAKSKGGKDQKDRHSAEKENQEDEDGDDDKVYLISKRMQEEGEHTP